MDLKSIVVYFLGEVAQGLTLASFQGLRIFAGNP